MIILDTNVISALMKPPVDSALVAWATPERAGELVSTTITRAEIRDGLARLPEGRRQQDLAARFERHLELLGPRWLPFDGPAADRYGVLVSGRAARGRPISVPDAQIASIAFVHRATLATRSVRDFEGCGLDVVDPFAG